MIKELYIEPTSNCNLHCVKCSRGKWENEPKGYMAFELFDKIMDEIPDSVTRIFFGGIGEPLFHPDIIYMIRRAKGTGRRVEMITNGTLLDDDMSRKITDSALDMLWISLDSIEEESYEYLHSGAEFAGVMSNIQTFNRNRGFYYSNVFHTTPATKLGIAFVLMKRNLQQFNKLLDKADSLGIAEVKATHFIPYDESQLDQICYERISGGGMYDSPDSAFVRVDMPLMDTQDIQRNNLLPLFSNPAMSFSFMGTPLQIKADYCRFIQEGVAFIRWDGEVCPCMALLHENTVYQQNTKRRIRPCSFGNIGSKSLAEVWESEAYSSFRKRVINFEFSVCTHCGPCEMFESNEEDCIGNVFPACGACLWAQGLFQCP